MEQILLGTMFELPGLDGVEEVVINREVAEGARQPAVPLWEGTGGKQRLNADWARCRTALAGQRSRQFQGLAPCVPGCRYRHR